MTDRAGLSLGHLAYFLVVLTVTPQLAFAADGIERFRSVVNLSCAENTPAGLECNPSVGMLLAEVERLRISKCTATLIGPDLAITNAHCLPERLRQVGQSCAGIMDLHFPQTAQYPREAVSCDRVLMVTGGQNVHGIRRQETADLAVIKLSARVSRPIIQLSSQGAVDNEVVKMPRMTPVEAPGNLTGKIETVSCRTIMGSAALPYSTAPTAAFLGFSDCESVGGNSGALLINGQGYAVAIHQSSLDLVTKNNFVNLFGVVDPKPFHVATNLACHQILQTALAHQVVDQDLCSLPAWGRGPSHSVEILTAGLSTQDPNQLYQTWVQNNQGYFAAYRFENQYPTSADLLARYPHVDFVGLKANDEWVLPVPVCKIQAHENASARTLRIPLFMLRTLMDSYYRPSLHLEQATEITMRPPTQLCEN